MKSTSNQECDLVGFGRYAELTCCGKTHRHNTCELGWLSTGRAHLFVDFQTFELEAGTMVFISPGQVFAWENLDASQDMGAVFSPELFSQYGGEFSSALYELFFGFGKRIAVLQTPLEKRNLFDMFFRTALERQGQVENGADGLLFSYVHLILAELQNLESVQVYRAETSTSSARLTQDFFSLIESEYLKRKKVQAYANMLGVTPNHLTETVRQQTGQPPSRLLQDRLVIEAKRLLAHTPDPVSRISESLSFYSVSQFARWFKQAEGKTPAEFRQQFSFP